MSWHTLTRKPLLILYVAGAVLLLVVGCLWMRHQSTDAKHVFWSTVEQELRTTGVTVESSQTANGVSAHQLLQYSFNASSMAHSVTALQQGNTSVTNEMIGTPTTDYTRYQRISTDQKKADGSALNFSQIVGVWAKSDGSITGPQLFPQTALGTSLPLGGVALPVANLSSTARAQLLDEMRRDSVYQVDYRTVKKTVKDGRPVYVYAVKINAVAYAKMMKSFAQAIGLHDLDQLDPARFAQQQDFSLLLTIDARAHHMIKAESVPQGTAPTAAQTYSSYDIPVTITLPSKTITTDELQKRLSAAQ